MIGRRNPMAMMMAAIALTAGMSVREEDWATDAIRLEARRVELRSLLDGFPEHLERVLAWAGDHPDVAEEAIRRIHMGWQLAESGTWEPPPPPVPIDVRHEELGRLLGDASMSRPTPIVEARQEPADTRPEWVKAYDSVPSREEARRMRQAARNKARRGAA